MACSEFFGCYIFVHFRELLRLCPAYMLSLDDTDNVLTRRQQRPPTHSSVCRRTMTADVLVYRTILIDNGLVKLVWLIHILIIRDKHSQCRGQIIISKSSKSRFLNVFLRSSIEYNVTERTSGNVMAMDNAQHPSLIYNPHSNVISHSLLQKPTCDPSPVNHTHRHLY